MSPGWRRVRALVRKELRELRASKPLAVSIVVMPVLFLVLATVTLYGVAHAPEPTRRDLTKLPELFARAAGGSPRGALFMMLGYQFSTMFLIVPAVLPSQTAGQSLARERASKSLEVLLSTPLRTVELVLGKALAGALPGVVPGLVSYALFVGVFAYFASARLALELLLGGWLLMVLLVGPLFALMSVLFGLLVSTRVAEAQSAQALSGVVVLPIVGLMLSQVLGAPLTPAFAVAVALALVVLDTVLVLVTVSAFERESVLVRWR